MRTSSTPAERQEDDGLARIRVEGEAMVLRRYTQDSHGRRRGIVVLAIGLSFVGLAAFIQKLPVWIMFGFVAAMHAIWAAIELCGARSEARLDKRNGTLETWWLLPVFRRRRSLRGAPQRILLTRHGTEALNSSIYATIELLAGGRRYRVARPLTPPDLPRRQAQALAAWLGVECESLTLWERRKRYGK